MAINCKISAGVSKECNFASAGVAELYFANYDSSIKDSLTFSTEAGKEGMVTAITLPTGENFYKVECLEDTASVGSVVVLGGSPDLKSMNHTVAGSFASLTPTFLEVINGYVLGKVIVAALMRDGSVQLLGVTNGLTSQTFDYTSGATVTDTSGVSFTFQGSNPGYPYLVDGIDVIKDLLPTP